MTSFDLISMAVRNLWKRKLRTFLTVLGVIIGTAAIIVMVSLGIGMNETFEAQLSARGNLRVITVNSSGGGYSNYGGGMIISGRSSGSTRNKNTTLDDKAVNTFKKIQGVEAVTPTLRGYFTFIIDRYVAGVSVTGVDPTNMEAFGYKTLEGRLLTETDEMSIVYGKYAFEDRFTDPKLSWRIRWERLPKIDNIMQQKMQITYDRSYGEKQDTNPLADTEQTKQKPAKVYKINIVGSLAGENENAYTVFMPIKQVQTLLKEQKKFDDEKYKRPSSSSSSAKQEYDSILVKCYNMEDVQTIQDQIKELGFQAYSLTDDLEAQKQTSRSMQALLGAIGAVSLLVAAIGITNTMVMSIYERTKEIGVMKVIGASIKDIKRLFLVEAALIGLLGGIFGVGVSLAISHIINSTGIQFLGMMNYGGVESKISSIPIWLNLSALGFSALVGIISGYFPARRAMNLSAISAIHTE